MRTCGFRAACLALCLGALLTTVAKAQGPGPTPGRTPTPASPLVKTQPAHMTAPVAPASQPVVPLRIAAPLAWTPYLVEGFESAFPTDPWTTADDDGPEHGTYTWARRDCMAVAGRYSLWAVGGGANGASLGCGADYPDHANAWAIAGPFDLRSTNSAMLAFQMWLNTESGYDGLYAMASADGREFYGWGWSGQVAQWVPAGLDLSNVPTLGDLMGQPTVWIALVFASDNSVHYAGGAFVDELSLTAFSPSTAPGAEDILIEDDFSDSNAYGWRPVEGAWWVTDGTLVGSRTGAWFDARSVVGNVNWTDYSFQGTFVLAPADAREVTLLFRVQDARIGENNGRYYQIAHYTNPFPFLQHHVELHRIANGSLAGLASSDDVDIVPGQTYHFRLEVRGSRLDYYLNERHILSVAGLTDYLRGGIGLKAYASTGIFDDIVVRSLGCTDPFEPDDDRGVAHPIQAGAAPQRHAFCQPSDEDWVHFEARADYSYTARTWQLGPAADTVLSLCDETTCLVTDDNGGSEPRASQVVWQAPRAGTFYLRVRQREPSMAGLGTHYNLSLSETPPPSIPAVQFQPILPASETLPSVIERGGVAHRYYNLSVASGAPLAGAEVRLSSGDSAVSNEFGRVDLAIGADRVAATAELPITTTVEVVDVSAGGQPYRVPAPPVFTVGVHPRPFTHAWGGGLVRETSVGSFEGLILYLRDEVQGGLTFRLDETDDGRDDDDMVRLEEQLKNDVGLVAGYGLSGAFVLDANVTTEVEDRAAVEVEARFDRPYTSPQQKAQAAFVLQGLDDIGQLALHSRPILSQVIGELQTRTAYRDYITHISAEEGVAWTPRHVHAGANLFVGPPGLAELTLIRVDAVEAGVTFALIGKRTDYPREGLWSVSMEQAVEIETALLTVSPLVKERVGLFVGDRTYKVREELFFHKGPDIPERFELTLVGKGNPLTFTNILMREVGYTSVVTGSSLQRALDAQIPNLLALLAAADQSHDDRYGLGSAAARRELSDFLSRVSFADYEVHVVTEGTVTPVSELTLGPIIKLEMGVELKQGRELVRERGQATLGGLMPTQSYPDDGYGQVSGKDIWDLLGNALDGAWQIVGDLFRTVTSIIRTGVSWLIQIVAASPGGSVQGGAVLSGSAGTQMQVQTWNATAPKAVAEVEVQAVSWVPRPSARTSRLALASGAGFVVGGAYQFSPAETYLSPAASLVLTYTTEAAGGADETQLRIYRWEEAEYRWTMVPDSVVNPTERRVSASIGRLGTYVIGYDAQPPVITVITPTHSAMLNTYHPGVMASVADAESGVDPISVSLAVDGSLVSAAYRPASGLMETVCPLRLSTGSHTLTLTARDSAGNVARAEVPFRVTVLAPTVAAVRPAWGFNDQPSRIHITGAGFQLGLSGNCRADVPPRVWLGQHELPDVQYVSTGWLEAVVPAGLAPGSYDLTVRNPDGQSATWAAAYTVRLLRSQVFLPTVVRSR
jgi:hypothetical protein